jgi:tRNA(Ile)-lysidine synthase
MQNLALHIDRTIRQHALVPDRQRLLVAVSGGVDSQVLLHVLHRLAAAGGWHLVIGHFNHQLRGRASDADERLVTDTARRLGLRCLVGRAPVRQRAKAAGESLEMAGRRVRHEFLARAARRLGVDTIATAHHADDQVELFFLRLLRGAGGGIAGMKWTGPSPGDPRIRLVRPLLDLPKTALVTFAETEGIVCREDASNRRADCLRNRVRHELIPWLTRRFQPGLAKTVLRLMEVVGEEHEFICETARAWLGSPRRAAFDRLHPAVQRHCVREQLTGLGVTEAFDLIEHLRCRPGKPLMVRPGVTVCRDAAGRVHSTPLPAADFHSAREAVNLSALPARMLFGGLRVAWRLVAVRGNGWQRLKPQAGLERFDAEKVGTRIQVRHWQPGDRFQPVGMHGSVKLQDLFTNQKILRARRRELVVAVAEGGEIFWVEGLRISERFMLDNGSRHCLKWQWQRLPAPA